MHFKWAQESTQDSTAEDNGRSRVLSWNRTSTPKTETNSKRALSKIWTSKKWVHANSAWNRPKQVRKCWSSDQLEEGTATARRAGSQIVAFVGLYCTTLVQRVALCAMLSNAENFWNNLGHMLMNQSYHTNIALYSAQRFVEPWSI